MLHNPRASFWLNCTQISDFKFRELIRVRSLIETQDRENDEKSLGQLMKKRDKQKEKKRADKTNRAIEQVCKKMENISL